VAMPTVVCNRHWAGAVLRHSLVKYRFTELYEGVMGPVNEHTRLTRHYTPDIAVGQAPT